MAILRKKTETASDASFVKRIFGTGRTGLGDDARGGRFRRVSAEIAKEAREGYAAGRAEDSGGNSALEAGYGATEQAYKGFNRLDNERALNGGVGTGRAMSARGLFGVGRDGAADGVGDARRRSGPNA